MLRPHSHNFFQVVVFSCTSCDDITIYTRAILSIKHELLQFFQKKLNKKDEKCFQVFKMFFFQFFALKVSNIFERLFFFCQKNAKCRLPKLNYLSKIKKF